MTRPARILLATSDAERLRAWTDSLRTARCQVITGGAAAADDVDVIVTDRPLSEIGLALDDERLSRGQTGIVAVGLPAPADVSLPADHSSRELRLACLLLSEIIRLRKQREASRRQERILTHLALSDPLTGLPNRRAWEQQVSERLANAAEGTPCLLALLDVDHFKAMNDKLGLLGGDACLKRVADRLNQALRRDGFAARLGGDEFAVLLEGVSPRAGHAAVERLRIELAEEPGDNGQQLPLALSAGWTPLVAPAGRNALQDALERADQALRQAKQAGRDRTCPREYVSGATD